MVDTSATIETKVSKVNRQIGASPTRTQLKNALPKSCRRKQPSRSWSVVDECTIMRSPPTQWLVWPDEEHQYADLCHGPGEGGQEEKEPVGAVDWTVTDTRHRLAVEWCWIIARASRELLQVQHVRHSYDCVRQTIRSHAWMWPAARVVRWLYLREPDQWRI